MMPIEVGSNLGSGVATSEYMRTVGGFGQILVVPLYVEMTGALILGPKLGYNSHFVRGCASWACTW